jgi:hypothetical protein
MDKERLKRATKAAKAKKTFELNGGHSQKHVRLMEAVAERRKAAPKR